LCKVEEVKDNLLHTHITQTSYSHFETQQRQKSVAEVKDLKEKLKVPARLMKMLRDENKSTVSNLSLASKGIKRRQ